MDTLTSVDSFTPVETTNKVSDVLFVFHINLLLLAIIIFFVVMKLPRAIALFGTSSDWFNGHILRYTPYRPSNRIVQAVHDAYPPPLPKGYATDDSHTLYTHTSNVQRVTEKGTEIVTRYPPHIASCIKQLRPLLAPLRSRISPGFSVGQMLVLMIYSYCIIYASFYQSNIFTDNSRTGWIATAQLPFVFAFAQKNNVLGAFVGYGYEKLNFLHRFVGIVVMLAANIHSFHYFYLWSLSGTFKENIRQPSTIWGMIALICTDMIFLFSTAFWRRKAYNIFLYTHIFGFALVLPAIYLHKPDTLPYIFASIALFTFDHVARVMKTRIRTAILRPLPELDVTRIEVPSLNAGWRAGQHVRLRVLSLGMGWWGWTESHPFTIANASNGPEGLVLIVKKTGTWTKRLYDIAKMGGYTDRGPGRDIKVMVEGPYGGPGHTVFSSFSAAVFVAGGSGISFAVAAVQDLIQKDLKGESRVKRIDLIWTAQDPGCLVPLLPILSSLIQTSVFTPVRICVYYTRAPIGKFPFADDEFFTPGLTLAPGRPRISKVLDSAICRAVQLGSGAKDDEPITGLVVGVCGPISLADDVVAAVNSVEPIRRDQVGGIEIHEEVFDW